MSDKDDYDDMTEFNATSWHNYYWMTVSSLKDSTYV